jgi:hypothetical protein
VVKVKKNGRRKKVRGLGQKVPVIRYFQTPQFEKEPVIPHEKASLFLDRDFL